MPTIVDSVELDETNVEFNNAAELVLNTNQIVYLTGKAGTGKTTFLKYIKSVADKSTIVLAPTGVAAINAGGVTINSFFQIPFGPFVPNDKRLRTTVNIGDTDDTTIYSTFKYREEKRNIIEGLELLIIDEISMVRCDTLDIIDKVLKVFRNNPFIPFGGVQVILIGDTFQLPPIAKEQSNEWQILSQFYESKFFFSSQVINKLIAKKQYSHIELKKIYRQKEQDFIDLLNRIRINQIANSDIQLLANKYNPTFSPEENDNFIILSTHNIQVDQTNKTKLDTLNTPSKLFKGELNGDFPKDSQGNYILPTELDLQLKEGAQVMFLKNDSGKRYFNGKIGKITSLANNNIVVQFSDGRKVIAEKSTWSHIEYTWNKELKKVEEKIKGTFTQYPLKLAWAITVHKSQGLTFEKVIADLGAAFEDGQVYVALSRCTSFNGLNLKTNIPRNAIRTSQKAIEFAQNETPETLIIEQLNEGKANYFYNKSRDALKATKFELAYNNFIKAIKFRNDIETEIFKRYFIAILSRLSIHKKNLGALVEDLEQVKLENGVILKKNNQLLSKNEGLNLKIVDLNKSIKISADKLNDLEKCKKVHEQQISDLENEYKKLNNNLISYQNKLKEKEIEIKNIENNLSLSLNEIEAYKLKLKEREIEINRLQNIKWHQKLLGSK